jgi:hypothetical protein
MSSIGKPIRTIQVEPLEFPLPKKVDIPLWIPTKTEPTRIPAPTKVKEPVND